MRFYGNGIAATPPDVANYTTATGAMLAPVQAADGAAIFTVAHGAGAAYLCRGRYEPLAIGAGLTVRARVVGGNAQQESGIGLLLYQESSGKILSFLHSRANNWNIYRWAADNNPGSPIAQGVVGRPFDWFAMVADADGCTLRTGSHRDDPGAVVHTEQWDDVTDHFGDDGPSHIGFGGFSFSTYDATFAVPDMHKIPA